MRFIIQLMFVLFLNSLFSQENEGEIRHALNHHYDINYRVNYFDKMIFKVDINSDVDNFYIPKLNIYNDAQSNFSPNENLKLRFSFDYKFLGLTYSFSPDFISEDNDKNADTRTLDLSFKFFYSDRWRQEVIFKKITGFVLQNPDNLTSIAVFNDLQINTFGGKTFFITNPNFSYRAYESQTERQIKSAGSFIPSISYYFNNVITNNPNNSDITLQNINSWDVLIQAGYMYNLVIDKKWFSTIGVHPGIGINSSTNYYFNSQDNSEIKSNNPVAYNYNFDFNFSLGYNHKNLFSGLKANYKNFQYDDTLKTEVLSTNFNVGIYVGYRFGEIKPIKKFFEKLEKKYGL